MTLTTTFVNLTTVDFKLKEGNAGVYREVTTLKGLQKDAPPSESNKHSLEFDEKATYREYRTVSRQGGQKIQINSDFCLDHSTIYIELKSGTKDKYEIRGDQRSKFESNAGNTLVQGIAFMASEDVPEIAHAAVTEEKTRVENKSGAEEEIGDEAEHAVADSGDDEMKPFAKGKRRNEQEAQVKAGKQKGQLPKKRFYRTRAHSNPLSDCQFSVPTMPSDFDWSESFPEFFSQEETTDGKDLKVRFADIGCGFGGLIVQMSPLFPKTLMIGMELRDKVSEYVKERIIALREQHPGQYQNISVLRTNAMKYLPNYFEKGQLQKMFFLFPDPHFKEKNHRRRIISTALLAEYAYIMAVGGILYTITDVQELGEWMKTTLDAHPLFQPLTDEELKKDVCVSLLTTATEEGQKVERNGGSTYKAIYRRIAGPGNSGA